ncbi:hypothetical protein EJ05DRAFT_499059 [Pseudovirgaria hyperparasitica]|uniref:Heterokaryon incompatibility domain-containing protein n=1 Tax=Pseudovirgaria hyperparasitica TaxID=470096 RepID=A0A6A6WDD2_9PEZI|nr:uncharacterized protein EJ05DRAFT_499059 [Pseudovirgaria hyperparasitica]KAF2759866.1 hypothetical protein EJ05DRAFT_499059 [Pseudovirgaria hyperparasitica]
MATSEDSTMTMKSIYPQVPLQLGQHSLRLLELYPGTIETPLRGELRLRVDQTKYEAVSWCWGEAQSSEYPSICLQDGISIAIRPNLHTALRHLRHSSESRHLWVDAICIDQDSEPEKNDQVPQMAHIYQDADGVVIWLGEPKTGDIDAIPFLHTIHENLDNLDDFLERACYGEKWNSLATMMRSPWFSRKWVVQEVALAKCATIHYGASTISWKLFCNINQLTKRRSEKLMRYTGSYEAITSMDRSGAIVLIAMVESLSRRDGVTRRLRYDLDTVVPLLAKLKVTVLHDHIFGVLALARDAPKAVAATETTKPLLPIDYGLSFEATCRNFLSYAIQKCNSLDVLFLPWISPQDGNDLPSWMPKRRLAIKRLTYRYKPGGPRLRPSNQIYTYYHLVGTYEDANGRLVPPRYPYEASSGMPFSGIDITCHHTIRSLNLHGFSVGSVTKVSTHMRHRLQSLSIPKDWIELANWPVSESEHPERFWRTLIANRWDTQDEVQDYYSEAFSSIMSSEHTFEFNNQSGQALYWRPGESTFTSELKRRIAVVLFRRRLILATSNSGPELLGLAPEDCEEGDLICILRGCSVPIILRKKDLPDQSDCYEVIGPCYVHGIMQGEAVEMLKDRTYNSSEHFTERTFEAI